MGCRNVGIPSSCATSLIPLTYWNLAMNVVRHLTYTTPSTERREALSWRVTKISMMGSPTLRARPSPTGTCLTTPKSTQVTPCMEE